MEHIIWSNEFGFIKDIVKGMEQDYPEYSEDQLYDLAYLINDDDLEAEKLNLNKQLDNNLVIFADLGLWYGSRIGYKVLEGSNLNNIFDGTVGDYATWSVKDSEVLCKDIHHDGTNIYTYRVLKPGVTRYEFEEEAYDSIKGAIDRYTEPLGHYIAEIYGWEKE